MGSTEHVIHKLYQYRKSVATKPYASRGKNRVRCELCLLPQHYCTCTFRRTLDSKAAFLLIMHSNEVLKPSNSGRLIADLIPQTHAYIWSRTEPDQQMLAIIENPDYQPFVIFPGEYAYPEQTVLNDLPSTALDDNKQPLFIVLDGSWRQAIKIFRQSTYLHHLPLLCFSADAVAKYGLRKGSRDFQLGTGEVGALALAACGEVANAASLNAWFDLFIESSIYGRNVKRPEELRSLPELQETFLQSVAMSRLDN